MKQEERLLFLIKVLLREAHMQEIVIPKDYTAQKRLYRALCNIREPKPLNDAFLNIQDAFLQEENQKDGITSIDDLTPKEKGIYLWQGDITALKAALYRNMDVLIISFIQKVGISFAYIVMKSCENKVI